MTHWEQTYMLSSRAENWVCAGCGCLVHDRAVHDQWHRVTRSLVGWTGWWSPPGGAP